MGRVVVVGSVNIDFVVRTERLPRPGETVAGGTFERHHGGKGANQAVAAARLGAPTVFVGLVGADDLGGAAREALSSEGVGVDGVGSAPGQATGVALILVDAAGENAIAVAPGANGALSAAQITTALDALQLTPADIVLVSNEIPHDAGAAALRAARAAGARSILNPAPADGVDRGMLEFVDIVTPNRSELAALAQVGEADDGRKDGLASTDDRTEVMARRLLREAPKAAGVREAVVVTLGAAGALIVVPPQARSVASPVAAPVILAVDATGAGDAFNGCLAAALASGSTLDDAVSRAVVAGALATTKVGARSGMPTVVELEAALARLR
jgi:ribokinase